MALFWDQFLDSHSFCILFSSGKLGGTDLGFLFQTVASSVYFYCVAFYRVLGPVEVWVE